MFNRKRDEGDDMINFKENEEIEENVNEEYDYMNEEPLEDEIDEYEDEEKEGSYCD